MIHEMNDSRVSNKQLGNSTHGDIFFLTGGLPVDSIRKQFVCELLD